MSSFTRTLVVLALAMSWPTFGLAQGKPGLPDSLNVNVTNTPLVTADAFPRAPVRLLMVHSNTDSRFYEVPVGTRFVVETVQASIGCTAGETVHWTFGIENAAHFQTFHQLPLFPTGNGNASGLATVRWVLEPGEKLIGSASCNGTASSFFVLTVHGYQLSVNSPSLAP